MSVATQSVSPLFNIDLKKSLLILPAPVASCIADFVALPLDVVKVHMQLGRGHTGSQNVRVTAHTIFNHGGHRAFFSGLGPAQLRQFTYGGLRMNIWNPIRSVLGLEKAKPTLATSMLAGGLSGVVASAICTPADVVKIRLQANPKAYRGAWHALTSIARTEGISKLYRGVTPTSARAGAVAVAELGLYDFFKMSALGHGVQDGPLLHVAGGFLSGVAGIMVSFPLDVAKTRLINQGRDGAVVRYRGMAHCLSETLRERGFLGMYSGCQPALMRQCTMNVMLFLTYEQLNRFCKYLAQ